MENSTVVAHSQHPLYQQVTFPVVSSILEVTLTKLFMIVCLQLLRSLEKYRVASAAIMAIFARFCPYTERASIDEAYLDLTAQINSRSTTATDDNDGDDCNYATVSDAPHSISSSNGKSSSSSSNSSSKSTSSSGSSSSAGKSSAAAGATTDSAPYASATTDEPVINSRTTPTAAAAAVATTAADIECGSMLEGAAKTIGIDGAVVDAQHAFDSRLLRGAAITAQIRAAVRQELGYTVSGGIAHNK
jgi:nucleotidyltransferase/DNA polymerase involved in DNA repair